MKTRISICICLAVLMVAGGSHCVLAGNDSAAKCFDEGAAFLDKGEYDKAIAAFEKAIELQPEEERRVDWEFVKTCHLKMGDCYHAKALSDPSEMIRAVSGVRRFRRYRLPEGRRVPQAYGQCEESNSFPRFCQVFRQESD